MEFESLNRYLKYFMKQYDIISAENFFKIHNNDINKLNNVQKFILYEKMVIIYFRFHNFEKCIKVLDYMKNILPAESLEYILRIEVWHTNILLERNNFKEALVEANRLRRLMFKSNYNNGLIMQDILNLLVRIFIKMDKVKKVKKIYRKLLADPSLLKHSKAKLFLNIGIMYYMSQNFHDAKKLFIYIANNPSDDDIDGYAYMYLSLMTKQREKLDYLIKAYLAFKRNNNKKYMKVINNEYRALFNTDEDIDSLK